MILTGNTILITGGGTGIGRGLAEAFHAERNQVIVTGRRRGPLEATVAANPGMAWATLDVDDPAAVARFAADITERHPTLNVLVNNAGVMHAENLLAEDVDLADCEATIATNLLAPIRLTRALLPHLRRQASASIVNVTSGLAFVPLAATPTYCATKAALHSYTESLRHQLRDTSMRVIELAPPLVATDLTPAQRNNPRAMPLADFIAETMALLAAHPDAAEICVERVGRQRRAEADGRTAEVFAMQNPV